MTEQAMLQMIAHNDGNARRIAHSVKVYGYARMLGLLAGLEEERQRVLELAAIYHDVGIRPALEKHGSAAGPLQEREGEPLARAFLTALGAPPAAVERVAFLVGHHHSYGAIDGDDFQMLVEADFLVNCEEGEFEPAALAPIRHKYIKTTGAQAMFDHLFPPVNPPAEAREDT